MLFLHSGAVQVDRNQLDAIPVPQETRTYKPLPYNHFIDLVLKGIDDYGYEIVGQEYAVSTEASRRRRDNAPMRYGAQLFAVLKLKHEHAEFATCLGLRSSYDKSLCNGMCLGNSVFVCDNLSFMSKMMEFRKHTALMLDAEDHNSIMAKLANLLSSVPELITHQENQIQHYKGVEVPEHVANDFVVRCAQQGVYPSDKILKVLKEFNEPRHPEFSDPTLWSLINAVTETLKGSNVFELQARTHTLYNLADSL